MSHKPTNYQARLTLLLGTQVSCIVCVAAVTWEDCASHADPPPGLPI